MNNYQFNCKHCGCKIFEEITEGVRVTRTINSVSYDEYGLLLDYGWENVDRDGVDSEYICSKCYKPLCLKNGTSVSCVDELTLYFKEQE